MKDYDSLGVLQSKAEKQTTPEPQQAGRAIAQLLHGGPEAPKPEPSQPAELPPTTEGKKRFDLGRMIAKVTGEAAPVSHPEVLQQKTEKLADNAETARANAQEQLAEMSELELDRHIEAQDQAIPALKPALPKLTPPPIDDVVEDSADDDSPTSISTVLANKSFKTDSPPHQSAVQPPIEPPDDDMALYKNYAKYGFIIALIIVIMLAMLSFLL